MLYAITVRRKLEQVLYRVLSGPFSLPSMAHHPPDPPVTDGTSQVVQCMIGFMASATRDWIDSKGKHLSQASRRPAATATMQTPPFSPLRISTKTCCRAMHRKCWQLPLGGVHGNVCLVESHTHHFPCSPSSNPRSFTLLPHTLNSNRNPQYCVVPSPMNSSVQLGLELATPILCQAVSNGGSDNGFWFGMGIQAGFVNRRNARTP